MDFFVNVAKNWLTDVGVDEETMNIVSNIALEYGYIYGDVVINVRQVINDHFLELNSR